MINTSQSLDAKGSGDWWITYISYLGATASPVAVAQYIEITNNTSVPQTVKSYTVAMNLGNCGRTDLVPIPAQDVQIWWTFSGLAEAVEMDFSKTALDSILTTPIPAHHTVFGWWFFDSKLKCSVQEGSKVSYRVGLSTFSGINYHYTTPALAISNKAPATTRGIVNRQLLTPIRRADISTYRRRLFSSPISEQTTLPPNESQPMVKPIPNVTAPSTKPPIDAPAEMPASGTGVTPLTMNNAPGGIINDHGVVVNPTVNNFTLPPPTFSYRVEPMTPDPADKAAYKQRIWITSDSLATDLTFALLFSGPFTEVRTGADYVPTVQATWHTCTAEDGLNCYWFHMTTPATLQPGQHLVAIVLSDQPISVVHLLPHPPVTMR
jgi:hypothetical protein